MNRLLDGFGKWDARYFLSISEFGYERESWIAFFPLYPWAIRLLSRLLGPLLALNYPYANLLAACLLSLAGFVVANLALYRLTVALHRNKQFALTAVKWFSFNPASVFFSAAYTESTYSALVFSALYLINRPNQTPCRHRLGLLAAALLLVGASCCRSNGITNVLFLLYPVALGQFQHAMNRNWSRCFSLEQATLLVYSLLLSALVLAPFLLVQLNAQQLFCQTEGDQLRALCHQHPLDVYSFVQETHWQVGFLRYYRWRKLPNFVLALPMLLLVGLVFRTFFRENRQLLRQSFLNFSRYKFPREDDFWNRVALLTPYLLHCAFLTTFAVLFINVEVLTRLLASSTPMLYWALAAFDHDTQWYAKFYFGVYFLVGICIHCNFLPWT